LGGNFYHEKLRISTYNVLFDTYHPEKIHTSSRVPVILQLLKETKSDIIGLQEVKRNFLSQLLEEEWVRNEFFVSSIGKLDDPVLSPYGQVLLSRFPFDVRVYKLDPSKRVILGDFKINEERFCVAVTHLSAGGDETDHSINGSPNYKSKSLKRMRQLDILFNQDLPKNMFLIGDFNFGDDGPENSHLKDNEFIDVWPKLFPDQTGFTYDRDSNTLIDREEILKSYRLDRICFKNNCDWSPTEMTLFGNDPICILESDSPLTKIHPSDHFGVSCLFQKIKLLSK